MGICKVCLRQSPYISDFLGLCIDCIRQKPHQTLPLIVNSHKKSRAVFGLPNSPPSKEDNPSCKICSNQCKIPEGQYGYCGLRKNEQNKIISPSSDYGKFSWYLDPLPTNCVADWVCSGGTGAGYPEYSYSEGPEYGYYNLAVFFQSCSFNCLYCQNWHFREETLTSRLRHISELLNGLSPNVSCICFFGGDPSTQIVFALKASRLAVKNKKGRILRICWETNGSMHKAYLDKMIEISLKSGGTIKFDLKAFSPALHLALTGVSNSKTFENFAYVAKYFTERPSPPLLIASTLLVTGYIDSEEVSKIAKFIATLNINIPYRILAFYPTFYMNDIPPTPKRLAYECYEVAKKAGLKNVSIGNIHLLK